MSNIVLPSLAGLAWNVTQSPTYSTKAQRAVSGKEYRAAFYQYPLWNFSMSYSLLRDANALPNNGGSAWTELNQLVGFFMARQGAFDSWLFSNPNDNAVTDQNFGTGDGATTAFQLKRTFGAGGYTADDLVQNVNAITNIKDNGVTIVQGSGAGKYTIDANGLITFGTAPVAGHALTWTGTFYYRCRLAKDSLDFNNFMQGLWELKKFEFLGSTQNKL